MTQKRLSQITRCYCLLHTYTYYILCVCNLQSFSLSFWPISTTVHLNNALTNNNTWRPLTRDNTICWPIKVLHIRLSTWGFASQITRMTNKLQCYYIRNTDRVKQQLIVKLIGSVLNVSQFGTLVNLTSKLTTILYTTVADLLVKLCIKTTYAVLFNFII